MLSMTKKGLKKPLLSERYFENRYRTYLKNKDHVRGQGAGRRKNVAYTIVGEAFETACNADIRTSDYF
jgi:hypothetical protein